MLFRLVSVSGVNVGSPAKGFLIDTLQMNLITGSTESYVFDGFGGKGSFALNVYLWTKTTPHAHFKNIRDTHNSSHVNYILIREVFVT